MTAWVGYYLFATGVVHNLVGVIVPGLRRPLIAVIKAGIVNKVDPSMSRYASVFFQLLGFWWMAMGHCLVAYSSQGVEVPALFGWYLLVINLVTVAMIPKSGFWALLIPAVWLIVYGS